MNWIDMWERGEIKIMIGDEEFPAEEGVPIARAVEKVLENPNDQELLEAFVSRITESE